MKLEAEVVVATFVLCIILFIATVTALSFRGCGKRIPQGVWIPIGGTNYNIPLVRSNYLNTSRTTLL